MSNSTMEELNHLFAFVSPDELRRSVNQVFFSYLLQTDVLPEDYKKMVEDIYFLLNFLEKVQALCTAAEANKDGVTISA